VGADKPYQIQQHIGNLDECSNLSRTFSVKGVWLEAPAAQRYFALYQGTTSVVPLRAHNILALAPAGP